MSDKVTIQTAEKPENGQKIIQTQAESSHYSMKEHFDLFGIGTFVYACFYAFCMFRNPSGITFPFFIAGSLLYFCFGLSRLGITLRKGSSFYMISMMLLAVSTFCTDDGRIIAYNKLGILLLMLSLVLNQFYDTSKWQLGKYLGSMLRIVFCAPLKLGQIFSDGNYYRKEVLKGRGNKVFYGIIGVLAALPLFLVVFLLLTSADAVFREMSVKLLEGISLWRICQVIGMIVLLFSASYVIWAYLCEQSISEEVTDKRRGEPVIAIMMSGMLTALYLIFCGIQIVYLFGGNMQLPEGYTYAAYAREGFFQLLAVGILNLILVLVGLNCFRESKVLKGILTVMSLCTFVMIASSALRMIIYIQYYYLTFLRILVLWSLVLLTVLFVGILLSVFRKDFPLFRYSCVAVTCCYLVLSFSHPDYWIAKINTSAIATQETDTEVLQESAGGGFFRGEAFGDYRYLSDLCADAAPVLMPLLAEDEAFARNMTVGEQSEVWVDATAGDYDSRKDGGTPEYIRRMRYRTEQYAGIRGYNVSRAVAGRWLTE